MSGSRVDRGWLRINSQPMRHYWYTNKDGDLYHALCGRLAAPYRVELRDDVPQCGICRSILMHETGSGRWTDGTAYQPT